MNKKKNNKSKTKQTTILVVVTSLLTSEKPFIQREWQWIDDMRFPFVYEPKSFFLYVGTVVLIKCKTKLYPTNWNLFEQVNWMEIFQSHENGRSHTSPPNPWTLLSIHMHTYEKSMHIKQQGKHIRGKSFAKEIVERKSKRKDYCLLLVRILSFGF